MKTRKDNIFEAAGICIITIIVVSTVIFWLRFVCGCALLEVTRDNYVRLSPSGIVDDMELIEVEVQVEVPQIRFNDPMMMQMLMMGYDHDMGRQNPKSLETRTVLEKDPNVINLSQADFHVRSDILVESMGIVEGLMRLDDGDRAKQVISDIYEIWAEHGYKELQDGKRQSFRTGNWLGICFNRGQGLFEYFRIFRDTSVEKAEWEKTVLSYAGPEGIGQEPSDSLGRFINPIRSEYSGRIVYDEGTKIFYGMNFNQDMVIKSSRFEETVLQYGYVSKNADLISGPNWSPPLREATEAEAKEPDEDYFGYSYKRGRRNGESIKLIPVVKGLKWGWIGYIPILTSKGEIYTINTNTLEISGSIGSLPLEGDGSFNDDKFFAYDTQAVSVDGKHKGLFVGYVRENFLRPHLQAFNSDGVGCKYFIGRGFNLDYPGGPGLVAALYLVECLHPAVLNTAGYVLSSQFDAKGNSRSLFALQGTITELVSIETDKEVEQILIALVMLAPSFVIGLLLAWWVGRNARAFGVSKTGRILWMWVTLLFGLAGLLSYIFARGKIGMVSCINCGRLRRSDMELCHFCDSKWKVPQLQTPSWRVIDVYQSFSGEEVLDESNVETAGDAEA